MRNFLCSLTSLSYADPHLRAKGEAITVRNDGKWLDFFEDIKKAPKLQNISVAVNFDEWAQGGYLNTKQVRMSRSSVDLIG